MPHSLENLLEISMKKAGYFYPHQEGPTGQVGGRLLSSQPALSQVTLKIAGVIPAPTHPGRITVTR